MIAHLSTRVANLSLSLPSAHIMSKHNNERHNRINLLPGSNGNPVLNQHRGRLGRHLHLLC
jgi:hypothetical protein